MFHIIYSKNFLLLDPLWSTLKNDLSLSRSILMDVLLNLSHKKLWLRILRIHSS